MTSLQKHGQRWLVVGLWLAIITGFWVYAQARGEGVLPILGGWLRAIAANAWGPLLLLGMFALRPLLLLPITILNVFAGFLFGPVWGLLYALSATLVSSAVAYGVGRTLQSAPAEAEMSDFVARMRSRSFETILTGRLIFLPGDLINYAAGFFRISFVAFMLATALGGLPGLLISVLAGASTEGQFTFQGVQINVWYLVASAALLGLSLGTSYLLRRRRVGIDPNPSGPA